MHGPGQSPGSIPGLEPRCTPTCCRAAWIEVTVEPGTGGVCDAHVTYRMTSLSPDADTEVLAFGDHFPGMLEDWQRRIAG